MKSTWLCKFTSSSFTVCMPFAPTLMPHRRDYDLCIYWRRMHGCTRLMIFFFFCLPEHICHLFVHRQCVFRACETSGNMSHVASRVYSVCLCVWVCRHIWHAYTAGGSWKSSRHFHFYPCRRQYLANDNKNSREYCQAIETDCLPALNIVKNGDLRRRKHYGLMHSNFRNWWR